MFKIILSPASQEFVSSSKKALEAFKQGYEVRNSEDDSVVSEEELTILAKYDTNVSLDINAFSEETPKSTVTAKTIVYDIPLEKLFEQQLKNEEKE